MGLAKEILASMRQHRELLQAADAMRDACKEYEAAIDAISKLPEEAYLDSNHINLLCDAIHRKKAAFISIIHSLDAYDQLRGRK